MKPTLIHAGAHKVDGNSMQPLAPESRKRIQGMIDDVYGLFTSSVGKHRPGLGAAGARRTEAGLFMGQRAIAAGLADRVATLEAVFTPASPFGGGNSSLQRSTPSMTTISTTTQPSTPVNPAAAAAEVARLRQANIDASWTDVVAKSNAAHGLNPKPTSINAIAAAMAVTASLDAPGALPKRRSYQERKKASREAANVMVAEQLGAKTQEEIDALWSAVAPRTDKSALSPIIG